MGLLTLTREDPRKTTALKTIELPISIKFFDSDSQVKNRQMAYNKPILKGSYVKRIA